MEASEISTTFLWSRVQGIAAKLTRLVDRVDTNERRVADLGQIPARVQTLETVGGPPGPPGPGVTIDADAPPTAAPSGGQVLYISTTNDGLYYWTGSEWRRIVNGSVGS